MTLGDVALAFLVSMGSAFVGGWAVFQATRRRP